VETEIARVKEKYSKLGPALVSNFDFNTRSGEKPSLRIILMGYPNFLHAENGHPCKMTRNEFSMPFNRDEGRGPRLEKLVTNVFGRLTTMQVTSAQTLEWTYAAPNDKKWNSHGFCAQSSPLEAEKIQERFIMPKRKKKHGWYSIEPTCPSEWDPKSDCDKRRVFDPRDYKTYGHRERWVRLPVDSKLSVDQQEIVWLFSVDLLFTDDWSTVMHPTAEGFAVNADSTLEAIRNLEASKRTVP
jgi:hypothetical protein